MIFFVVALLLLLAAVWFGLIFSRQLVVPMRHQGLMPPRRPLLQMTLAQLFAARQGKTLTYAAYKDIGGQGLVYIGRMSH